ncbi:tetratricopeptide repeat protein [Bacteroidota bacterium]
MRKFYLVILFVICGLTYVRAQTISEIFASASEFFHQKSFAKAHELYQQIDEFSGVDDYTISTAKFYSAECLFNMKQLNGAAAEFEYFVDNFLLSYFRYIALYRLGTIYFNQREFSRCREKFISLLNDYNLSEYSGAAYYWIGESFAAENKFFEAQEFLLDAIKSGQNNRYIDYSIFTLASIYERTGDYEKAVKYYDQLLAYHRDSELASSSQLRIGICYFNLREYDSAVLELSDPLIRDLSDDEQTEAEYYLANAFFRLKEFDNAENIYKEILDKFPDEKEANQIRFGLAWLNFQRKNYDEAFRIFEILSNVGRDTLSVNSLYWSAESKRYSGDINEAVKLYNSFLEKYPESKLVHNVQFNIGIINYNNGDFAKAERYLEQALDSYNDNVRCKAYTLLAEINLNKHNFRAAKEFFLIASSIDSANEESQNRAILGAGVASYFLENYDDALNYLSDLYLHYGDFEPEKVSFFLAETYFIQDDFASALRHYNRVSISDNSLGKQALYGKAYAYFNLKDYTNAAIYFNDYLNRYKNDENTTDVKLRLADSYYGMKNFDKASNIYQDVFLKDKKLMNNDYAYFQYGQALFKAGRPSDAIREFSTLQSKFPNSKYADDSQYIIGWIHFQQNDFYGAIKNYTSLFEKYPRSGLRPIAYYSIGDSYYNVGKYGNAIESYLKIIDEFPNTQFVFDAINGIQYCYISKNEPDSAIVLIDQFMANNSSSPFGDQILFKKGELYYSLGEYEFSKIGYKEFIHAYPNSSLVPNAYYWIGKCEQILGSEEEAEDNFSFVVDEHLESEVGISAVIELGNILVNRKDYETALRLYDKTINELPLSNRLPEVLYAKASAQVEMDNKPGAYETYDYVINYYDGSIFASKSKIELGLLELDRKSYANAEILFKEVTESKFDDIGAEAGYHYGVTLFEQNKISDAISVFVRIRSVYPAYDEWYTKSLLKLGDCYAELGDKAKAREMYKAVIQRHQRDSLGNEANYKLNRL